MDLFILRWYLNIINHRISSSQLMSSSLDDDWWSSAIILHYHSLDDDAIQSSILVQRGSPATRSCCTYYVAHVAMTRRSLASAIIIATMILINGQWFMVELDHHNSCDDEIRSSIVQGDDGAVVLYCHHPWRYRATILLRFSRAAGAAEVYGGTYVNINVKRSERWVCRATTALSDEASCLK